MRIRWDDTAVARMGQALLRILQSVDPLVAERHCNNGRRCTRELAGRAGQLDIRSTPVLYNDANWEFLLVGLVLERVN